MKYKSLMMLILAATVISSCARNPERFYFGDYSEAEYLFKQGEYSLAIQKYQSYIDENPEGNMAVISKYYIAKSRQELGQVDDAKMIYQEIVNKYPDVVWANFAKTQLEQMEVASA